MIWSICFAISVALAVGTAAVALTYRERHRGSGLLYIVTCGIALSAVATVYPMNLSQLDGAYGRALLLSVHNVLRLFVLDDDFSGMIECISGLGDVFRTIYGVWAGLLYLAAPVMTLSVVLNALRKYAAYRTYLLHYRADTYIFSELNERSLTLAADIRANEPRSLLIFTGVRDDEDYDRLQALSKIRALRFQSGMTDVNFSRHSAASKLFFFEISDDDSKNISEALALIERYRDRGAEGKCAKKAAQSVGDTRIYVFSDSIGGKLLLENVEPGCLRVQRVNEAQRTVASLLYGNGNVLFDRAVPIPGSDEKQITAVVVGFDAFADEMLRALPWMCQMTGYRVAIHLITDMPDAAAQLRSRCPELMDERFNGLEGTDQDACYSLAVHDGVSAVGDGFDSVVGSIPGISFAFVSQGDDEANTACAVKLRMLCERAGATPAIWSVSRAGGRTSELLRERSEQLKNQRGNRYDISFVGDLATTYSMSSLLYKRAGDLSDSIYGDSTKDLEERALKRHLIYSPEWSFWGIEYNYRSSLAAQIHCKYKRYCKVPGADLAPAERDPESRELLRRLEHRRWNAYVRSEGYIFAEVRNELAKTHPCLRPFNELSEADQAKDDF